MQLGGDAHRRTAAPPHRRTAAPPHRVKDYFCAHFSVTTRRVFDYAPFMNALHALGRDLILFCVNCPCGADAAGREVIAHGNTERLLRLALHSA
ncbi:hypothetical protein ACQB60_35140 [Actinomycetota bacterium Odt1-20B]